MNEEMEAAALQNLRKALTFLDLCRSSPKEASDAGCFEDAREWLEEAARGVVAAMSVINHG